MIQKCDSTLMAAITHDDRFTEVLQEGGKPRDMCEVLDRVEARGEARGKQEGENKAYTLMQKLFSLGRVEDAQKASSDEAFRKELYKEFHLA